MGEWRRWSSASSSSSSPLRRRRRRFCCRCCRRCHSRRRATSDDGGTTTTRSLLLLLQLFRSTASVAVAPTPAASTPPADAGSAPARSSRATASSASCGDSSARASVRSRRARSQSRAPPLAAEIAVGKTDRDAAAASAEEEEAASVAGDANTEASASLAAAAAASCISLPAGTTTLDPPFFRITETAGAASEASHVERHGLDSPGGGRPGRATVRARASLASPLTAAARVALSLSALCRPCAVEGACSLNLASSSRQVAAATSASPALECLAAREHQAATSARSVATSSCQARATPAETDPDRTALSRMLEEATIGRGRCCFFCCLEAAAKGTSTVAELLPSQSAPRTDSSTAASALETCDLRCLARTLRGCALATKTVAAERAASLAFLRRGLPWW